MNSSGANVSDYILSMITYIKGDLSEFNRLCKEVEINEKSQTLTFVTSSISPQIPLKQRNNSLSGSTPISSNENEINPNLIILDLSSSSNAVRHFRMTIPITLTLFSAIDVLGYFVGNHSDATETIKNFTSFFAKSRISVSRYEITFLNRVFRQGLVHVYFPKLFAGISYHSTHESEPLFFKSNTSDIILNVNMLVKIVTDTMDSIYKLSINNKKMNKKFTSLMSKYENENEKVFKELTANIKYFSTTTNTTTQG